MSWKDVDKGWGDQAKVWASIMEPRWWPEFDAVLRATDVGEATQYLDIACGSGLMVNMASRRGAQAHGLDASDRLLALARRRTPTADIQHGDMNDLPWEEGTFDVATSCRGIWGPNQDAVHEAARVLKPGGCLGLSFFAAGRESNQIGKAFHAIRRVSEHEIEWSQQLGQIGQTGRAEEMCETAGLIPGERQSLEFDLEGADIEHEVKAWMSAGPAWMAIQERGAEDVEHSLRTELAELEEEGIGVRTQVIIEFVVAQKPS
ncbi:MAG: class I SAM-dependent methyltransferase [Actinomycetota bacterium]|jgi:ubiquinone/menaquinone biosynthesis C-methylase UbiE|nr:class I SAM-dependent methyltransferase [Actinomycetota bacterium]MEC9058399.1 class I SAM-dependent methyltransferase [Actinomycetota bacterium]|tara:strand:- start:813 stop:1595 length:783 start_codon:yes stop_codon:yes gene_type:complete